MPCFFAGNRSTVPYRPLAAGVELLNRTLQMLIIAEPHLQLPVNGAVIGEAPALIVNLHHIGTLTPFTVPHHGRTALQSFPRTCHLNIPGYLVHIVLLTDYLPAELPGTYNALRMRHAVHPKIPQFGSLGNSNARHEGQDYEQKSFHQHNII